MWRLTGKCLQFEIKIYQHSRIDSGVKTAFRQCHAFLACMNCVQNCWQWHHVRVTFLQFKVLNISHIASISAILSNVCVYISWLIIRLNPMSMFSWMHCVFCTVFISVFTFSLECCLIVRKNHMNWNFSIYARECGMKPSNRY